MTSGASATSSAASLRCQIGFACGPADVDPHVAAFAPAQLLQPLPERRHAGLTFRIVCGAGYEHADAPHPLALPRARERPRRRSTEKRDELAPLHLPLMQDFKG